jgi:hypothetical protein
MFEYTSAATDSVDIVTAVTCKNEAWLLLCSFVISAAFSFKGDGNRRGHEVPQHCEEPSVLRRTHPKPVEADRPRENRESGKKVAGRLSGIETRRIAGDATMAGWKKRPFAERKATMFLRRKG